MEQEHEADADVVSLDQHKARRFLDHLEEDPFICLVATSDGEIKIFSKDIDPEHHARIREVLTRIKNEEID